MRKILLILFASIVLGACSQDDSSTQREEVEPNSEQEIEEKKEDKQEEITEVEEEEDVSWDDLKNKDKIIGKSDKDFSTISKSKPSDVNNDVTGNWKKYTIADNINIEEYALSYKDLYMHEDEVHFIINFNYKTTTMLSQLNGLLYVDVKEYVDKEEHDAKQLGSGMDLANYKIYPDGDIEEVDMSE